MNLDPTKTVAEMVLDHPSTAAVFQAYRIDFCCRGGMSLADACSEKGIDAREVSAALEDAIASRAPSQRDPRTLSTAELVEHITTRHHAYLRKTLPFLEQLATKVARVHGEHEPKLVDVRDTVLALKDALEPHLDDEEKVLFPAVLRAAKTGEVQREISEMTEEHIAVGELLSKLRSSAAEFVPPEWACNSYRTLMRELEAFESDTFKHVHLENQVLVQRFTP